MKFTAKCVVKSVCHISRWKKSEKMQFTTIKRGQYIGNCKSSQKDLIVRQTVCCHAQMRLGGFLFGQHGSF